MNTHPSRFAATDRPVARLSRGMAGLLMFCLVSFTPLHALAQAEAPSVRLTSYDSTVSRVETSDWWYYWWDGTTGHASYWSSNTTIQSWTQAAATNSGVGLSVYTYTDSTPFSYVQTNSVSYLEAWPDLTQFGSRLDSSWWTTWYDGQLFDNGSWSAITPDLGPPREPWPWCYVRSTTISTNGEDWGYVVSLFSDSVTENVTTTIELRTGGAPGSTNSVVLMLGVWAFDNATSQQIDPTLITILGLTPDTNGSITITNNENLVLNCTPSLPPAYTNYTFYVSVSTIQQGEIGGVEIDRMEYKGLGTGNQWIPVTGTLYALKDDVLSFRVIPSPTNAAWPAGYPWWTIEGVSAGGGAEKAKQFSALSTSASDFKQVIAQCGASSYKTSSVVVFNLTPRLTPEDNFSGRSYSTFGVGEWVDFDCLVTPGDLPLSSIPLIDWTSTNQVNLINTGHGQAQLRGPSSGMQVTVKLDVNSGPSIRSWEYNLLYVPPTAVDYVPSTRSYIHPNTGEVLGTNIWHQQFTASVGRILEVYLQPANCSFSRIRWREGFAPVRVATNYLSFKANENHPQGNWAPVSRGNAQTGCKVVGFDTCSTGIYGQNQPRSVFQPYGGEFGYDIPLQYEVDGLEVFYVATAVYTEIVLSDGSAHIYKKQTGPFIKQWDDASTHY